MFKATRQLSQLKEAFPFKEQWFINLISTKELDSDFSREKGAV